MTLGCLGLDITLLSNEGLGKTGILVRTRQSAEVDKLCPIAVFPMWQIDMLGKAAAC